MTNSTSFEHPHPAWQATPCIPFSRPGRRHGYAYAQFQGRQYLAHRLAFALNQGAHPSALQGVVVRHSCDNRECINVGHLLAGSAADNMNDKVARNRQLKGEQIAQSKLTAEQVAEIRRRCADGMTQRRIAAAFGVSQTTVSDIAARSAWKHI